jgi:hypothetical protein
MPQVNKIEEGPRPEDLDQGMVPFFLSHAGNSAMACGGSTVGQKSLIL